MMKFDITIRKQSVRDQLLAHGTDFQLWYDQGDVLNAQSANIDYPMAVSKENVKGDLQRGKMHCELDGKCFVDIHINKFYTFHSDPQLIDAYAKTLKKR